MNKLVVRLLAAASIAALATAASAQTSGPPPAATNDPEPAAGASPAAKPVTIPKGVYFKRQTPGQFLGRDRLLGQYVVNSKGETVGQIEDLIFSAGNTIEGVVLSVGGFLGVGEKRVGVRLGALSFTEKDGKRQVGLNASKEQLAALGAYERAEPRKSALERAKEKGKVLLEQGRDAAQKGLEAAKPMVDKAKEAVGSAAEKAKEAVKGSGEPKPEPK